MFLWFNRVKYVEQELAKKRGKSLEDAEEVENELKRVEDELYKIPDHLKVCLLFFRGFRLFDSIM